METIKRVLLTGGGTAGHVNPALAIGSLLGEAGSRFMYVGVRGRVEEEVVPREGIPIRFVHASAYPGLSPKLVAFILDLLIGIIQSLRILLAFRPQVVVGTGGYASAPVVIAASLLRRLHLSNFQIFIHEQNVAPGRLNQLMGRFAQQVFVTFPDTLSYFPKNGALVGYPLRKRIVEVDPEEALRKIGIPVPEGRKIVFAFGGSQGSRTINRALVDALGYLLPNRERIFIIHGAGLSKSNEYNAAKDTETRLRQSYSEDQLRQIRDFYVWRPFFHEIELVYAVSDLVVVRGGAGSLNEISAMGLPALIIPKSNLPGNHQVMNARAMERAGGAEILYEEITPVDGRLIERVDGKILAEKLISLLCDGPKLEEMSRHSGAFLCRDALARIESRIREVQKPDQTYALTDAPKENHLPGNRTLLARLEMVSAKYGQAYSPELVIPCRQDLEFLKNRATALLIHASWQERNIGVKLLGLLKANEKIPALLALLNDRTPASRLKRLLGGDFEQVGFIRRNILAALVKLNELSPEIEEALLLATRDPYYEVRAEAVNAAAFFGSKLSSPARFISTLLELLNDSKIDVAIAAAVGLGKLGGEDDALPALLGVWDCRLWKIRAAALRGIACLVERGKVAHLEMLERQVPKFILTSTDFAPQFEMKSVYRYLMGTVSKEKEREREIRIS